MRSARRFFLDRVAGSSSRGRFEVGSCGPCSGAEQRLDAPPREPNPPGDAWTASASAYFEDRTWRFVGAMLYWVAAIPALP
jgi:hypothetical protein